MSEDKGPFCKPENCMSCQSKDQGLVGGLCNEALEMMNSARTVKQYKKNQVVFLAGDHPTGLYCVSQGIIKVESESSTGKGHLLRMAGPGDFLGYRAFFADDIYEGTAVATEEAVICHIPKKTVHEVAAKHPEFALQFLGKIARDVRNAEGRMMGATDKEAAQRVAESLLFLKGQFPDHKWTRKEISEWAGTTPETVMRTLSDFVEKGWIRLEGRVIHISNKEALYELADLY